MVDPSIGYLPLKTGNLAWEEGKGHDEPMHGKQVLSASIRSGHSKIRGELEREHGAQMSELRASIPVTKDGRMGKCQFCGRHYMIPEKLLEMP
jgi:hypothetical protein